MDSTQTRPREEEGEEVVVDLAEEEEEELDLQEVDQEDVREDQVDVREESLWVEEVELTTLASRTNVTSPRSSKLTTRLVSSHIDCHNRLSLWSSHPRRQCNHLDTNVLSR